MSRLPLFVALALVLAGVPDSTVAHGGGANDSPLADAGLDQRVERGATVWLDGGGSVDPDGEVVAHEWSIRDPDGAAAAPAEPTAAVTTFEATTVGRYAVTLTVTDDHGAVRSDTLYVTVTEAADAETAAPNEAPVGRIDGPDTVGRGESASFTANAYDPDGEIVSYEWSDGSGGRSVSRAIDAPAGETFSFSVRVTDDDGATSTFRTSVTVRPADRVDSGPSVDPANRRPEASVDGPARVAVGREASFVLRGSDSDGRVVDRRWTAPVERNGAVLRHTFDAVGTYTVSGSVVDDDGATATASRTVEVYDEGPPVVEIDGPDTAETGSSREYTLDAADPDGGELTVRWSPAQNQLERASSRFVNNVRIEGRAGDIVEVSATVTDDEGNSVTVVKETAVEESFFDQLGNTVPRISKIRSDRYTDDSYQTSGTDSVELGSYDFAATIKHEEPKLLRATWRINDTEEAIVVDTLGRFIGSRDTSIRHTFVSESGGKVAREVSLTAIDADGDLNERKWISRVHSVQTHDEIVFYARRPDGTAPKESLQIEPGEEVAFTVGSNQNYRLTFGDGAEVHGSGTPGWKNVEIAHSYLAPGSYKARLMSTQGPKGEALETVDVVVRPETYIEHWYETTAETVSQVASRERPSGDGWYKRSVHDSGTIRTGRTVSVRAGFGRPSMVDDNWTYVGTKVTERTQRITRIRRSDPDGTGDSWRLKQRNVRTAERTYYEDRYRWFESRFRYGDWSFTGETRSRRVVVGDGHDHDRERHTRTTRTCTNWDLTPSFFGGFSRECARWDYDTDVWYTGHDHDGRTYYDTDYRYHTEVERTKTVYYHSYVGTSTRTVTMKTFAETESWVEWLWEREDTAVRTEYSLTKPARGTYVEGSLRTVEVRCDSEESHHDSVMC